MEGRGRFVVPGVGGRAHDRRVSRYGPDRDRITVARLEGAARRHVYEGTPRDVAVAELVEIATERRKGHPAQLRTDLLDQAAGVHLGGWQVDPRKHWVGEAAVQLLVAAGADLAAAEREAAAVRDRLRRL